MVYCKSFAVYICHDAHVDEECASDYIGLFTALFLGLFHTFSTGCRYKDSSG